jgi:UDP-glucose 4-epimerase
MTTVLVTGAGGYIGGRLSNRLVADGYEVRALVRAPLSWPTGIEQVIGDLVTQPELAKVIAQGVDVVIHLAGANEVDAAQDPERVMTNTVDAARRVAEAGIPRIMYLSTVHVYGTALSPGVVVTEETAPEPVHPYAQARLACEQIFEAAPAEALIFRLTNGVGAPSRPEVRRWSLVANELCREAATAGRLTLRTPGVQWRDFIALHDVESLLSSVARAGSLPVGTYNLGTGRSMTILQLAALIQDAFESLGRPRPELEAPPAPADPPGPYRVDVSKLGDLGVRPQTALSDAIAETARFCVAHRSELT